MRKDVTMSKRMHNAEVLKTRLAKALMLLFVIVVFSSSNAVGDTYTADTAITGVSITEPTSSGKKWLTDSTHDLECTTSTDCDYNVTLSQQESDSVTHYWTATAGTFLGNDNTGTDDVTYVCPGAYQTDEVTITAHADDDYAPESNDYLYDEDEVTDEIDVIVMEVGELDEAVSEQIMDHIYVGSLGEHTVSYSSADGDLRFAMVLRSNSDADYTFGTTYDAAIDDEDTGDVAVELVDPGIYILKTVRTGGTEYVMLCFGGRPSGGAGTKKKTGRTVDIAFPSQELILLSASPQDNGWLANANLSISGEVWIVSVQAAITAINNKWAQTNPNKFSLAIIDHAKEGFQAVGDGNIFRDEEQVGPPAVNKFLDNTPGNKAARDAFMAACNGKVSSITFYGCRVGDGTGGNFLQTIATGANATTKAHKGSVYCIYAMLGLWNHWEASNNGDVVTKNP